MIYFYINIIFNVLILFLSKINYIYIYYICIILKLYILYISTEWIMTKMDWNAKQKCLFCISVI